MFAKYLALVHGKTMHAVDSREDTTRPLSLEGIAQVRKRAQELRQYPVGRVFVSPAQAARETAGIAFPGFDSIVVPELYFPGDEKDKEEAHISFTRLKDAPLRSYVQQDTGWLIRWGFNALKGIQRELGTERKDLCGTPFMAVVGHKRLVEMLGALLFPAYEEAIQDLRMQEAEMLTVVRTERHTYMETLTD